MVHGEFKEPFKDFPEKAEVNKPFVRGVVIIENVMAPFEKGRETDKRKCLMEKSTGLATIFAR